MAGLPEIDLLDFGMGGKVLALVCWHLMYFLCFCAGRLYIYFRKIAGKYTNFKEKCWKNFYRKLKQPCEKCIKFTGFDHVCR